MAWIESHQELAYHPKVARLARALDIGVPTAIGHLHCFWWWCMSYADDGDVTEFTAFELAHGAQWLGDPDVFLDALQDGWLDPNDGRLEVHDWWDYAGKLVERRRTDAERKRKGRAKDVQGMSHRQDDDVSTDGVRTQPNQPNQPNPTNPRTPQAANPSDLIFEALVEVCYGTPYESGMPLTSRERGILARAKGELSKVGATPDELRRRAGHFFAWVGQLPTPDNLVTHWNRLAQPQQRATPNQMKRLEKELDRRDRDQKILEAGQ